MLKWIFKMWDLWSMDWIDLAQNRDRWQAHVNVGQTFGFHKMRGIF
jgi:hypothetical protein